MGQEEEAAKRMRDFAGFQITEDLLKRGGAKPNAIFMHCLPRHKEEVDDAVFYGPKSVVFQEAENRFVSFRLFFGCLEIDSVARILIYSICRKWTILACVDAFIGRWSV